MCERESLIEARRQRCEKCNIRAGKTPIETVEGRGPGWKCRSCGYWNWLDPAAAARSKIDVAREQGGALREAIVRGHGCCLINDPEFEPELWERALHKQEALAQLERVREIAEDIRDHVVARTMEVQRARLWDRRPGEWTRYERLLSDAVLEALSD